jgi:hypothetical protein
METGKNRPLILLLWPLIGQLSVCLYFLYKQYLGDTDHKGIIYLTAIIIPAALYFLVMAINSFGEKRFLLLSLTCFITQLVTMGGEPKNIPFNGMVCSLVLILPVAYFMYRDKKGWH